MSQGESRTTSPAAGVTPAAGFVMPQWQHALRRLQPTPDTLLGVTVTIALLLLIGAPMAAVLAQAFLPDLFFDSGVQASGIGALFDVFERPLWRVSLTNSLLLASGTAILGTVIGAGMAMLRFGYRFPGAGLIDLAAWAMLVMPSFIVAQGWVLFASREGLVRATFGWTWVADFLFSIPGLITVMALKTFPLAYLAMAASLRWNMDRLTTAARLCGGGPVRVLLTVRLPLLMPAILSGMLLVFVDTIGDFGLPAALATTFRFPTLPYTIYAAINQSPVRFDLAGVLALYLFVILLAAISLYFWLIRRGRFAFLTASSQITPATRPRHAWLLSLVAFGFVGLALGIPLGTSLMVSFLETLREGPSLANLTLGHYIRAFDPRSGLPDALANSLTIAGIAAVISGLLAFLTAYLLTFSRMALTRLIDTLVTMTLAVPGVILGVGCIFVWNHPALFERGLALYGYPSLLVVAAVAGAVPIAVRVMLGTLAQIPNSHLNAAALQGASLTRRLVTVLAPLAATALLSGVLAAFGTSVFDLAVTAILRPPGFNVLPPVINRQFIDGDYGLSTASTMIGAVTTIAIIAASHIVARRLINRWLSPPPASETRP